MANNKSFPKNEKPKGMLSFSFLGAICVSFLSSQKNLFSEKKYLNKDFNENIKWRIFALFKGITKQKWRLKETWWILGETPLIFFLNVNSEPIYSSIIIRNFFHNHFIFLRRFLEKISEFIGIIKMVVLHFSGIYRFYQDFFANA